MATKQAASRHDRTRFTRRTASRAASFDPLSLLRVHPEPFVYLDERWVHRRLARDPSDYLQHLARMLTRLASGRATIDVPRKVILADRYGGDFRVMPAVLRDSRKILKTVKIVGTNRAQRRVPDQITVGKAFCLDPKENFITHIIEACLLSSARTGACAAVAMHRLATRRCAIAVRGAGRVGYYAALYASAIDGVEEVVLQDKSRLRAARTAAALRMAVRGRRFRAESWARRVAADVLILATTSCAPLCAPSDTDAPVVVSLGADATGQRELADEWASVADLYVDSNDSTRVGDLRAWVAAGKVSERDLTSLIELWKHASRLPSDRRRVFISTGSALLDNLTIDYLLSGGDRRERVTAPGVRTAGGVRLRPGTGRRSS